MNYEKISFQEFYSTVNSEEKAVEMVWKFKESERSYQCTKCRCKKFYTIKKRPGVRECKKCGYNNRVRKNTIFENSNIPLQSWLQALYLMMTDKLGVSALTLEKKISISYKSALLMQRKIRRALQQRDQKYKLEGLVEVDGTKIGKRATGNQKQILVAVEKIDYKDKDGRKLQKAGFAKLLLAPENQKSVESFIQKSIRRFSNVHTDYHGSYINGVEGYNVSSKAMYSDPIRLNEWLPMVHKITTNLKTWVLGTYHGVWGEYVDLYIAEYIYRFNRRHDEGSYFTRALKACVT